jgi:hypothetical protein
MEIRESNFATATVEGGLFHKIEGIERCLFIMEGVDPQIENGVDNELVLLRFFIKM